MTENRRSFLRKMAIAPAAMPTIAEAAKSTLMGQSLAGYQTLTSVSDPPSAVRYASQNLLRVRQFLRLGLPKWKRDEIERHADYAWPNLCPEVLSMRSVSDVAKRRIGRERAAAKLTAGLEDASLIEMARAEFFEKEGPF